MVRHRLPHFFPPLISRSLVIVSANTALKETNYFVARVRLLIVACVSIEIRKEKIGYVS